MTERDALCVYQRKFVSLFVCNSLYDGVTLPRLHDGEGDVIALHNALAERGVHSVSNGPVMNASLQTLKLGLFNLVNAAKNGDTVLVHYSGHGVATADGGFYFMPINAGVHAVLLSPPGEP